MATQKADLQKLQGAAGEITQQAEIRHATEDAYAEAREEHAVAMAEWEARQKTAQVEAEDDFEDDFDDDVTIRELESKRLSEMKKRFAKEKEYHMQQHGVYREIVEEEFLKEVCGSEWVAVHFFHEEFIRCKVMDKHLKLVAYEYNSCKFLKINAEKAPFFVTKIGVQVLPTVVVFQNGKIAEMLMGFEDLGGTDDFKTPALINWLATQGCIKMKNKDKNAYANGDQSEDSGSEDEMSENYDY